MILEERKPDRDAGRRGRPLRPGPGAAPRRVADAYAVAVGRFYEELAERLVAGARGVFEEAGADGGGARGAGRLRAAAGGEVLRRVRPLRRRGLPRRGDPRRDRPLRVRLQRGRRGIARVQLDTGVPCAFGVLTVDTLEQALERAGEGKRHQGEDAARAVLRMAAAAPRARTPGVSVNLYSDTQTRPSEGMRRAIAEAEVGDEQRFLDPTVNAPAGARGRAARPRGRAVPPDGHDVQRDRAAPARPGRRATS